MDMFGCVHINKNHLYHFWIVYLTTYFGIFLKCFGKNVFTIMWRLVLKICQKNVNFEYFQMIIFLKFKNIGYKKN
jgi:hypothetical protein